MEPPVKPSAAQVLPDRVMVSKVSATAAVGGFAGIPAAPCVTVMVSVTCVAWMSLVLLVPETSVSVAPLAELIV